MAPRLPGPRPAVVGLTARLRYSVRGRRDGRRYSRGGTAGEPSWPDCRSQPGV